MKRIWILLGILLLLGGAIAVKFAFRKDNSTNIDRAESNFKVENPATIGRIILTHRNGVRSDLKRKADYWTINDQYRARQSNVDFLLTGIQRQHLDHIPNRAASENILSFMSSHGIHVEIFDLEGKTVLDYYVGGVTPDDRGTFFLKEGTSQPYCLVDPGFEGALRVRYAIEPIEWRDVHFFDEDIDKIDTVKVDYPHQKQHAFKMYKSGGRYEVVPLYSTTPLQKGNTDAKARSYLTILSQLACEDYIPDAIEKDSVLQIEPFMSIDMIYPDRQSQLRFFIAGIPVQTEYSSPVARYFVDYTGHDFMIGQHEVMKGAFRSYDYFFN